MKKNAGYKCSKLGWSSKSIGREWTKTVTDSKNYLKATESLNNFRILQSIQINSEEIKRAATEHVDLELREYLKRPPDYITDILHNRHKELKNFKLSLAINPSGSPLTETLAKTAQHLHDVDLANNNDIATFRRRLNDADSRKRLIHAGSLHVDCIDNRRLMAMFNKQIKACARDMHTYDLDIKQVCMCVSVNDKLSICDGVCVRGCGASVLDVKEFFGAVKRNWKERVQGMVKRNRMIIFGVDDNGQTGLHMALRRGFNDIATFIILEKGPINKIDDRDARPLDIAIQNNDIEMSQVKFNILGIACCRLLSLGY